MDAGAGKADVANQDNSNRSPSTTSRDPWLCDKCYDYVTDGHLKKCPGCKSSKPAKHMDKVADTPKSAISKDTQKLLATTDPDKKQEEDEARTNEIAELERGLVKYKDWEFTGGLPIIVEHMEQRLTTLKKTVSSTNSTQAVKHLAMGQHRALNNHEHKM